MPAVEVLSLGEVGVAPQDRSTKPGSHAQPDRLIDLSAGLVMRGTVARAVQQTQHFAGFGQTDDQRVVAPSAIVSDVHARLALAVGSDQRAVHVDGGPVEERPGLLGPDFVSGLVDGGLESVDVRLAESSAEVASGGGIGDAACPESIEEGFIVAAEVDVLKAGAVAQSVVGDVEDVVGLVIGQMDFQEVETLVDGLWESELVCEHVDGPDAAVGDGSVSVRNVVFDGAT